VAVLVKFEAKMIGDETPRLIVNLIVTCDSHSGVRDAGRAPSTSTKRQFPERIPEDKYTRSSSADSLPIPGAFRFRFLPIPISPPLFRVLKIVFISLTFLGRNPKSQITPTLS
jgi:hypothetical protein